MYDAHLCVDQCCIESSVACMQMADWMMYANGMQSSVCDHVRLCVAVTQKSQIQYSVGQIQNRTVQFNDCVFN